MKKQLLILNLSLSTLPFSFYELKGPYGIDTSHIYLVLLDTHQLHYPIELLDTNSTLSYTMDDTLYGTDPINIHLYLCIYNQQTGYSIGYASPWDETYNDQIISFFKGKNYFDSLYEKNKNFFSGFDKTGWVNDYTKLNFYFFKEKPNQILEGSITPLKGYSVLHFNKSIHPSKINLSSSFVTSSGITVENGIDNVQICKGDKKIYFEDALKDSETSFINNVVTRSQYAHIKPNNEKNLLSKNVYNLLATAKKIEILKNSNILAIYAVIKGDDNKDSIVWGLAQDKSNPDRKFHYIVDLKDDISKLIK